MIKQVTYSRAILSIYQQPKKGERMCGDIYFTYDTEQYIIVGIADGLGSGEEAFQAASHVLQCLEQSHHLSLKEIFLLCNHRLHHSRGAVLGIMKFFYQEETVRYASIGNIQLVLFPSLSEGIRGIPRPGYLSGKPIHVREEEIQVKGPFRFIMYSDGFQVAPSTLHFIQSMPNSTVNQEVLRQVGAQATDDLTVVLGEIL